MTIVLIILLLWTACLLVILAAPVSVRFDSTERIIQLRWMGVPIGPKQDGERRRREKGARTRRKDRTFEKAGPLLWERRDIAWQILRECLRCLRCILESVDIRELDATVSTPDTTWNGVLAGALSATRLQPRYVFVNFEGVSYARGLIRMYPYRIAWNLCLLTARLPLLQTVKLALQLRRALR